MSLGFYKLEPGLERTVLLRDLQGRTKKDHKTSIQAGSCPQSGTQFSQRINPGKMGRKQVRGSGVKTRDIQKE